MKLILNNNVEETIQFDTCSRNLNMGEPNVFFDIYVNANSLEHFNTMQYITKYADDYFTAIKVTDNDDNVVFNQTDIIGKIASYSESFGDGYYNANAAVQILKSIPQTTPEETE